MIFLKVFFAVGVLVLICIAAYAILLAIDASRDIIKGWKDE